MFKRKSTPRARLAPPALFLLLSASAMGQAATAQSAAASGPATPAPADRAITAAIARISPEQVHADIAKLVSFKNRSTLSSLDSDLPPNTGALAAADWIASEFEHISEGCNHCLEVKRDDFIEPPQESLPGRPSRIVKPTRIVNIYAVLRGTDPAQADRRVLVTGHYDSRNSDNFNTHDAAPGANDDASGVAVSLESARALTQSGIKFPATIVFAAVAGEEQGLDGSAHLARLAKQEGWQLEAVLNNDIVGGDTTPGETMQDKTAVRVFSEGVPGPTTPEELRRIQTVGAESDSPSRELARAIAEVSATYFPVRRGGFMGPEFPRANKAPFHPVLIFRRDRFLRGGDHSSFNAEGFAAVRFTEWRENFNHQHQNVRVAEGTNVDGTKGQVQYGDLIDFVDFNYVTNVARLNAAALATFALAPGDPQNVKVITTQVDNNTQLTWDPPKGFPAGATYEVVMRDTSAPTWTTVQPVGTHTSVTLPISKDNTIFGIRSVDVAGHRSPAVYPWPTRAPSFPQPAPKPQ
jgi:hypothetical protein